MSFLDVGVDQVLSISRDLGNLHAIQSSHTLLNRKHCTKPFVCTTHPLTFTNDATPLNIFILPCPIQYVDIEKVVPSTGKELKWHQWI